MAEDILSSIPALRLFAFALCGQDRDADELVAATLETAIYRVGEHEPAKNVRVWLYALMNELFHDQDGKRPWDRELPHLQSGPSELFPGFDPSTQTLFDALASLPERYRIVLVLVGALQEGIDEIAGLIGSEAEVIRARLALGRDLLEEELPRSKACMYDA